MTDKPQNGPVVLQWLSKNIVRILFSAALLFISAGRLDWIMGWVYIGLFIVMSLVIALVTDPELIAERNQRSHPQFKNWDRILLNVYSVITSLVTPLVAGLNVRFGWEPQVEPAFQIAALLINLLGWGMHIWSMVSNKFFSRVVRIQDDRGQTVATLGPYRYVRHPGYVAGIIFSLTTPLLLGSAWALIPGILGALLLVLRTGLEDRTLHAELEGYPAYAQQVRYRLLPGIW